jgi:hypothetical protein
MTASAPSPSTLHPQAPTSAGIRPRPTLEGLVVNGPQRWPWYDDEDERANHSPR